MKLYELDDTNLITAVPPFDSEEWYLAIAPLLNEHLFLKFSERQILEDPRIDRLWREYANREKNYDEVKSGIVRDLTRRIQHLLIGKNRSYAITYRAITEEFDPLWNVDGTETLTYARTNTGTVKNEADQTDKNTGTQTNDAGTTTTDTTSATTYDSPTWKDTDKNVSANSGRDTRTDNLQYKRDETDTRTDDLTEEYTETRKRGGNIGVTKSTELIQDTIDTFQFIDFLDMVARDIANAITCRTY
jgi:hypothetical protein